MDDFARIGSNFSQARLNAFLAQQKGGQSGVQPTQTQPKKKKGFWMDQLSTLGGIGGGIAGSFAAPILGTAVGAGAGSALGEAIENALSGQRIMDNVGKEALLGGVFGAGPGKLAKGAVGGGKALLTGEKVIESASKAAMTPLRKKAGQVVLGAGDDIALKNFKINDSKWLNEFKSQIGEDAGQFARTRGFTGKSPDELIETIQKPLQNIYKQSISKINPIPKAEIENGLKSIYEPLLKNIAPDNQLFGQELKAQADQVIGRLPKTVNAADAYDIKKTFDDLVDQSLTDSAGKLKSDTNKRIADVFRSAINKQADASGIKFSGAIPISGIKATNLKELGKELQGIDEFIKKAGIKSQVGRGKNIVGLTPTMAASGALASGNPALAVPAVAGTMFANSKAGSTGISRALSGAGNLLQKGGDGKQSPLGIASRVVTGNQLFSGQEEPEEVGALSLEDALMGAQSDPLSSATTANNANMPMASNIGQSYQGFPSLSSGGQQQSNYSRENAIADIQRDPKNADYYMQLYEFTNPVAEQPKLTSSAITQMSEFDNSLANLDEVEGVLQQNQGAFSPIMGRLKSLNPYDKSAGNINQATLIAAQNIGRALEGGKLTDEDIARYQAALPNITDTPEKAQAKIDRLRRLIQQQSQNYGGLQAQYSGNSGLADALMAQGQGSFY